jgi:hypothetical protein
MPSLGIGQGDRGDALLKCAAGCTVEQVASALGLTMKELFMPSGTPPTAQPKTDNPTRKPKKTHATLAEAIGAAQFGQSQRLEVPKESIIPAGHWEYQDAAGKTVAAVARFNTPTPAGERQKKQFSPLHAVPGGWQVGDPTSWPLYHLPAVLQAIKEHTRIWWVEGEKKADAAAALGMVVTTTAHGAKSVHLTDLDCLAAVDEVCISPDNDEAGEKYVRDIAPRILGIAPLAKVRIVRLPNLPPHGDFVEYIAAWGDAPTDLILQELDELVEKSPPMTNAAPPAAAPATLTDSRPGIMLTPDEHIITGQAVEVLATDANIYRREGMLVRTVREPGLGTTQALLDQERKPGTCRPGGSMTIEPIPDANLRERLTRLVRFTERNWRKQIVQAHPPAWLVAGLQARRDWPGIRYLMGTSDAPVLRPDGSIWQTPGYDAETGVLFDSPTAFPHIPAKPTIDDARSAAARLLDIVCDFRFETLEHQAAWLAALLTPLARFAFTGACPLFLIDANIRGAGKGLLANVISTIIAGRDMPICAYAQEVEEMKKIITSVVLAGDRMVLLDNISGSFGNAAMDAALTGTTWKGRLLGQNLTPELPLSTVWFATGNNVMLSGDMCRRTIHIRMNVEDEHPEDRENFKYTSLLEHVLQNRPSLLTDALTILSAFLQSGAVSKSPTLGSFIGWSHTVRGACLWLGLPDPVQTQRGLAETSESETDALAELMTAWSQYATFPPDSEGIVLSHLLANLYPGSHRDSWPADTPSIAMRAAIESFTNAKPGQAPTPHRFANRLKRYRKRVMNGRYFEISTAASNTTKGIIWALRKTSSFVELETGYQGEPAESESHSDPTPQQFLSP